MTAGWIVALVILAAFSAFGYAAYRKRWPSSPKLRLATSGGKHADSAPAPAKEPEEKKKKDSHDDGHHKAKGSGNTLSFIVKTVAVLFAVLFAFAVLFGFVHSLFSIATNTVAKSKRSASVSVPMTSVASCTPFSAKMNERESCLATGPTAIRIPEGVAGKYPCWGNLFKPGELQLILPDGTSEDFIPSMSDVSMVGFIVKPPAGETRFVIYWLSDTRSCEPA